MMRGLLTLLCLTCLLLSAGCYYSVKHPDGTTERISREEYEALKDNRGRSAEHIGVPQTLE